MTEQTRRATRLVRIRELLVKRGSVSCAELSDELGYSQRTIQRDIAALESELGIPLIYEARRWKLMPGAKLVFGPVRLTFGRNGGTLQLTCVVGPCFVAFAEGDP